MAQKDFRAFEEWRRDEASRWSEAIARQVNAGFGIRPGARLSVEAEVAAEIAPSVVDECRTIALNWVQNTVGSRLPRKAWRFRPFSFAGENTSCVAVRVRDRYRDLWSIQVKHTPARDHEVVMDISVVCPHAAVCHIAIAVQDRSAVPADGLEAYPADMLADIAERVPLIQGGRRLTPRPIVADSEATMKTFLRLLVDPGRSQPFAVISAQPEEEEDPGQLETQSHALARSLTGLAVTWVLPAAMTYRLSDTVSKPLSVFLGAWRFYRAGFNQRARKTDHPLILKNRMVDDDAVAGVVRMFVRMAAAETVRAAPEGNAPFAFDAIAREAAEVARGPARLVTFLRNSLGGRATRDAGQGYAGAATGAGAADRVEAGVPAGDTSAPAYVGGPSPATAIPQADPALEPRALLRQLRAAKEKARQRASQYERTRQRAEQAERERDNAIRRAEQLAGLVRSMGGDPDAAVPFPTTWDEFGDWCDERLAGRVTLTGSARRELSGAEFKDVGLAAQCLCWLGGEYREGRLKGGNPHLHGQIGEIAERVFDAPCGGDTFDCSWCEENHSVDWHLKVGGNTRDPRRCLRIYYFWDEGTRQVVVASMPGHRRSVLS